MAGNQLNGLARRWKRKFPDHDASTIEPTARLGAAGRAIGLFHGDVLREYGLQLSDYQVLSFLLTADEGDSLSPTSLSQALRQTPAGMTKTLDRLEEKGLIRRASSTSDRRSTEIRLTTRGERAAEEACLAEAQAQRALFSVFSKTELATLNSYLSRLLDALGRG